MTVQGLIDAPNEVEDKTKIIYVYTGKEQNDIEEIDYVDEMDDRVDINMSITY